MNPGPRDDAWGTTVSGAGSYHAPAGKPYPPDGHPPDHGFRWEDGRVLGAYQLLFIRSGEGRFESGPTGARPVKAGQVLVLFPHVWHRYRPAPAIGWHEEWIELRGSIPSALQKNGVIAPEQAVLTPAETQTVALLFHRTVDLYAGDRTRPDPLAAAWALELLARLARRREGARSPRRIALAVARAESLLAETAGAPPSLEPLARSLGVAYSYFRREFKAATGVAPGQYARRIRLERARRLLGTTPISVKQLAEQLGFSSEFHFSAAFKRQFGVAPANWRARGQRR
ncbi:MAG TPA: AraC family transcriptional regulator [Opitutaceae bacterium]|nr:AraC family transcriptional regulator [Opitutaceae bacterium]